MMKAKGLARCLACRKCSIGISFHTVILGIRCTSGALIAVTILASSLTHEMSAAKRMSTTQDNVPILHMGKLRPQYGNRLIQGLLPGGLYVEPTWWESYSSSVLLQKGLSFNETGGKIYGD